MKRQPALLPIACLLSAQPMLFDVASIKPAPNSDQETLTSRDGKKP